MASLQHYPEKLSLTLLIIFILLTSSIGFSGYYFYMEERKELVNNEKNNLSSIADLKVNQIAQWRQERINDGRIIQDDPFVSERIGNYIRGASPSQQEKAILAWMGLQAKQGVYTHILLLDSKGKVLLSVPSGSAFSDPYERSIVMEAFSKGETALSDFQRDSLGGIFLDLVIPLSCNSQSACTGVLLLRIDPHQFLYPLIRSWPTPSKTAETLLVHQEGNEIVYLNELRHRKDTALTLRFPVTEEKLPAVMAVQGKEGFVEGTDYRGENVAAYVRSIPDSPWFIVAKIDIVEVFAPLRDRTFLIIAVMIALTIASGFGVGMLQRQQQSKFYKKQYEDSLERQALTQHLDYLTKFANDIILLLDDDWRIVEANDRALDAYGYSRDELIHMDATLLRPPELRSGIQAVQDMLKEKGNIVVETRHMRKNGTTFPVEISSRVIDVDGKKYIQSILRDITERKKAEEALRRYAEEWAKTFDSISDLIFIQDKDFTITKVNRAFVDFMKMKHEDIIGRKCFRLLHGKDSPWLDCPFEKTRADKQSHTEKVDDPHIGVPLLVTTSPLLDERGEFLGSVHIAKNISEQKKAEEKLAAIYDLSREISSAMDLGKIFENVIVGCQKVFNFKMISISLVDEKKQELYVKTMVGHPEEILCLRFPLKGEKGIMAWVAAHGESLILPDVSQDPRYVRGSSKIETKSELAVPLRVGERIIGVINVESENFNAFSEDDRKLFETLASQTAIAVENARLFEEVARSNKLKEMFISIISHDLKNPLSVVRGYNELLSSAADEKTKSYSRKIEESVERVINMIDEARLYSRVKDEGYMKDFEEMGLGEIIDSALASVSERASQKKISILFERKNPKIHAHRTLENLFINLLDNAIKYSPEGSTVEIGIEEKEGAVTISIKDFGKGIPDEFKENVFEKFERGKVEGIEGSGLGLAIAREIVQRHSGRIWVEDNNPCGSVFFVELSRGNEH